MNAERTAEIKAATKENPVTLTEAEITTLREENKNRFQMNLGAGKYVVPAKAGSPADKMLDLKLVGKSNAEIADALGLSESTVKRVLARTY